MCQLESNNNIVVSCSKEDVYNFFYFSKIKNRAYQPPDKPEHTSVAEMSSWSPVEDPNILFMLYDVGGHESYKNTAHVFQVSIVSTTLTLYKQWVQLILKF